MPRRQKWTVGDYFVIPLADGSLGTGQIVAHEPEALNSVLCGFSSRRYQTAPVEVAPFQDDDILSVVLATRDLLDNGRWRILNRGPAFRWQKFFDLEALRRQEYVGAEIIGSGNIESLLNACHRLAPWNDFFDPGYLDTLLVSADRKPRTRY